MAHMVPPPGMFPPGGFPPGYPPMAGYGAYGMPPYGMTAQMPNYQKPKSIDEKLRDLRGLYDDVSGFLLAEFCWIVVLQFASFVFRIPLEE
jgi:hypothetical protein